MFPNKRNGVLYSSSTAPFIIPGAICFSWSMRLADILSSLVVALFISWSTNCGANFSKFLVASLTVSLLA